MIRGITDRQEQKESQLIRDTRTITQKMGDFLRVPFNILMVQLCIGALAFVLYPISDLLFLIYLLLVIYGMGGKNKLPFRMPQTAHLPDLNDPHPATGKPMVGKGIYFFGNDKKTKDELWFTNDDMRTHALIFGSTGSGKTVSLVGISYNALVQSSGFIYVDGKGDNTLFATLFGMAKFMGRLDDFLLINFMTGARDISGAQEKRLSNTLNPFASGSSGMLSNLIVSMMDSGGSGGDGDMWKGRAINFVEGLMRVLVAMRDAGNLLLDANTIRNYFGLDRIEAMVVDRVFIRDGQYSINIANLPDSVMEPMKNYLHNVPGYNPERKGRQVSQVLEQHGYITMQLVECFHHLLMRMVIY